MVSKLKYGNTNTFLIRGTNGSELIGTDYAGTLPAFYREIKKHDIKLGDSISIILDDGNCFVGDLEPMEYLDGYEDNDRLKEDWKLIMSYNPKVIYYAHANEKYKGIVDTN